MGCMLFIPCAIAVYRLSGGGTPNALILSIIICAANVLAWVIVAEYRRTMPHWIGIMALIHMATTVGAIVLVIYSFFV